MPNAESLRIFISSTFVDLKDYRQAVFTAILGSGLSTENMIFWSADERSPLVVSIDRVRQSDAMILIVAHRYGYIPGGEQYSITEQEYLAAREAQIPVLAFLVDEKLPWPPEYIEWERRNQLSAFKGRLASELTSRTFTSIDHLASLVSQALATLRFRNERMSPLSLAWVDAPIQLNAAADAKSKPDLNLHIGEAEDGLPIILNIQRSCDIGVNLSELERLTSRPGVTMPTALISSFRQMIEDHAQQAWASYGISSVRMANGSLEELLVCKPTLSKLFKSSFACLLSTPGPAEREVTKRSATVISVARMSHTSYPSQGLQSEGGSNRFLGISIKDGTCFSVGRERHTFGQAGDNCVEWRPFVFESLIDHFPDSEFIIDGRSKVTGDRYTKVLMSKFGDARNSEEARKIEVSIQVSRASVAGAILDVCTALSEAHANGRLHGDLKPANILITSTGILLIDEFQLKPGQIAPGWTPEWSAPEQALGEPVSLASDIYPLGRMIAELLGGRLVGEVRKFKVSFDGRNYEEFDVFYDPSIRLSPSSRTEQGTGVVHWIELARRCLRFRQEDRPALSTFVGELKSLIEKHPLKGFCHLDLEKNLVRASFGGSAGLARLMIANMRQHSVDVW